MKIQNIKIQLKGVEYCFDNMMMGMPNMNIKNQIQNMGAQLLNMGIEMFNISFNYMGINSSDSVQNLRNISLQIENIINQMNNNMMPMNNNFNMLMNNNNNFISPMNFNFNSSINNNNDTNKIRIIFKNTKGTQSIFFLDRKNTVREMLINYLLQIQRTDSIIIKDKDEIGFIYNAHRLSFEDNTKIDNLFENSLNPIVLVNEIDNLIGG